MVGWGCTARAVEVLCCFHTTAVITGIGRDDTRYSSITRILLPCVVLCNTADSHHWRLGGGKQPTEQADYGSSRHEAGCGMICHMQTPVNI